MEEIKKLIETEKFLDLSNDYSPVTQVFEGEMRIREIQLEGNYKRVVFDYVNYKTYENILNKI
ncbi:MAG: hypothetical protein ACTSO9_11360 [Candidatus Helarchaeota archaeon]